MKIDDIICDNNISSLSRSAPTDLEHGDIQFEMLKYLALMDEDLKNIQRYYKKTFSFFDGNSIFDYIHIFKKNQFSIYDILYTKEQINDINKISKKEKTPFSIAAISAYKNNNAPCLIDKFIFKNTHFSNNSSLSFSNQLKAIKKYLTNIFLIEKYVSVSTRKIWQSELQTNPSVVNLNKNFNILVKVIFPNDWSNLPCNEKTYEYFKEKKYQSTSLIDKNHKHNLFLYKYRKICACLMVETKGENIVCARDSDAFSTELIDGFNGFNKSLKLYNKDISKVDQKHINNKTHECFASATQIATPKGLFGEYYNEVVVFDPKYVAVISPNRDSDKFAEEIAKIKNLPIKYM